MYKLSKIMEQYGQKYWAVGMKDPSHQDIVYPPQMIWELDTIKLEKFDAGDP